MPAAADARGERMLGPSGRARTAWTWGMVGGRASGSAVVLKLATLATRLTLGDPAAGAVVLSTADDPAALVDFAAALGPPERLVDRLVAQARGR